MTAIGANNYNNNLKLVQPQSMPNQPSEVKEGSSVAQVENKQVTISEEGRALLAASSGKEIAEQPAKVADKGLTDKVESFAQGVLGMDHPDDVKEKTDDSYSAGQFIKGALTVGALLLAVV